VSTTSPLRVAIVEQHQLTRDAFRALLEATGVVTTAGEATDASEVVPMIERSAPDVVLLVIDGSSEREVALLHVLPDIADRTNPLIVTTETDAALHAQAIELGARGVVLKDQAGSVLVKAIQKVCAGEIWLDRARTAGVLNRLTRRRLDDDPDAAKIDSLTRREREIVTLVTEGLTNKDIAERLFISEATARNHLTSILDKLDVTDRFQLTVYAFRRGLVLCPQTPAMLRVAAKMAAQSRTTELPASARLPPPPRRNGEDHH
jgi:DNA-binding NarL/FixJ family response regulator